jgi:PAS domain S-box-containing protein
MPEWRIRRAPGVPARIKVTEWFWETGPDQRFTYFSNEGADATGLVSPDIIGKRRQDLAADRDDPKWARHLADLDARRAFWGFEYSARIADGSLAHLSTSGEPRLDDDGRFLGYRGATSDITARKCIERELRDARELFDSLMQAAPFEIVFKDREGKYLQVNRTWEHNNGRTNEDVVGRRTREIFPAQFAEAFAERDRAVLEGGQIVEAEEPASHIDGTTHDFLSIRFPLNPADRSATAGLGFISMDITARKQAERALLEREEELGIITDNLPVLMARFDRDWRYRFINREGASWYGMPASEIVGKTIPDLFPGKTVEDIRPSVEAVLRGENARFAGTMEYPDGKLRNIEITFAPDRTPDGAVRGWFALAQDTTARKRVERELADARELFNTLMQAAPFEIVFKDREGKYLQVNRTWERNHGQTNEEVVGRYTHEIIPSQFADVFADRDRAVLEGGQIVESEEPAPHPDGTIHDFLSIRFPLAPAGRSATAGLGLIAMDITARKQAERALLEREEELSTIADNLPVLITQFNREGRFEFMNRAGEEWYGRPTGDVIGKTVSEILGAESYAKVEPWINRALKGERVRFEERMYYPDDTFRDVDIAYIPDVSQDGEIRGCFGLVQNITERKAAESRLCESEEQLRTIADNLPAFITHVDRDQRYRFANRVAEEWYGRPASEIIGRHLSEIHASVSLEKLRPRIESLLAGQDVRFEDTILYPDNVTRTVDQRWIVDRDENGQVCGWFSLIQDISERKRLEEDLLRQERLAAMGQLTGTVAHELRNPLGAVAASIAAVRRLSGQAGLDLERSLARAERGIARSDRIITELLDFARAKGLQREPTRFSEWLSAVIADQDIPDGVSLSMDTVAGDAEVMIDREDFRRAIINVFDNACQAAIGKHGPGGSGEGRVEIACGMNGTRLVCEVRDNGPGIPADCLSQVMEPLYSTKSFGTGLGLPTVQRIMEEHGGGIEIESEAGKGALVRLWLPVDTDPPEERA